MVRGRSRPATTCSTVAQYSSHEPDVWASDEAGAAPSCVGALLPPPLQAPSKATATPAAIHFRARTYLCLPGHAAVPYGSPVLHAAAGKQTQAFVDRRDAGSNGRWTGVTPRVDVEGLAVAVFGLFALASLVRGVLWRRNGNRQRSGSAAGWHLEEGAKTRR